LKEYLGENTMKYFVLLLSLIFAACGILDQTPNNEEKDSSSESDDKDSETDSTQVFSQEVSSCESLRESMLTKFVLVEGADEYILLDEKQNHANAPKSCTDLGEGWSLALLSELDVLKDHLYFNKTTTTESGTVCADQAEGIDPDDTQGPCWEVEGQEATTTKEHCPMTIWGRDSYAPFDSSSVLNTINGTPDPAVTEVENYVICVDIAEEETDITEEETDPSEIDEEECTKAKTDFTALIESLEESNSCAVDTDCDMSNSQAHSCVGSYVAHNKTAKTDDFLENAIEINDRINNHCGPSVSDCATGIIVPPTCVANRCSY
jgi:hypothetical protein